MILRSLKYISVLLLLALTLSPAQADPNFSITTDGLYARQLSGKIGHHNGCGGSLLLEFEPVPAFSLGLDLDSLFYWGVILPGVSLVEGAGLVGRFNFNPEAPLPVYLIVGGGINPKIGLFGAHLWNGDAHLFGGLGTKFFLDPRTAIDFSAVYDHADAPGNPLETLQGRIGFSFFFANAHGANQPAAKPTPAAAPTLASPSPIPAAPNVEPTAVPPTETPVPETTAAEPAAEVKSPSPAGPQEESIEKGGYSLWDISEKYLGDPELYPILVDANKKRLKAGRALLTPGTRLTIPDKVSDKMKRSARSKAWKPAYTRFRGRGLTKKGYQRWRYNHGLSSTWKDPDYSGGKP